MGFETETKVCRVILILVSVVVLQSSLSPPPSPPPPAKTLPLPYLFPELYNTVDLDAISDDMFPPVEVKECTKRDGSGGERLNKHVVYFCWIFMFQQPLLGLII